MLRVLCEYYSPWYHHQESKSVDQHSRSRAVDIPNIQFLLPPKTEHLPLKQSLQAQVGILYNQAAHPIACFCTLLRIVLTYGPWVLLRLRVLRLQRKGLINPAFYDFSLFARKSWEILFLLKYCQKNLFWQDCLEIRSWVVIASVILSN